MGKRSSMSPSNEAVSSSRKKNERSVTRRVSTSGAQLKRSAVGREAPAPSGVKSGPGAWGSNSHRSPAGTNSKTTGFAAFDARMFELESRYSNSAKISSIDGGVPSPVGRFLGF